MKLKPINQQVVVILGASSGIGRETALEFARRGANVVVAARSQAGLNSLLDKIRAEGGEARAVVTDTRYFDQVQRVAGLAVEAYGRLDTWVHAAAVSLYATFDQTTPEEFRHVIETNLMGQVYGAMAALPHLRQTGGGALIHISSVEGKVSLPYQSAYAASKHGMIGFLNSLRLELQHEDIPISVTNIMPTSINTPFFSKARTKLGVHPKGLPPIYQPHLAAEAILYAAENPVRDLFVGGPARLFALTQSLSPQMTDAMLRRMAFEGQLTDQPKSVEGPNAFYEPLPGYDRVEGIFSDEAKPTSIYTWLELHPTLATLAGTLALGVAAGLLRRVFSNGSNGASSQHSLAEQQVPVSEELVVLG